MILNDPKPPAGSSSFVYNGSITLDWTMEDGDPQILSFDLGNNSTGTPYIWTIGVQVATSLLTYTAQLSPYAPAGDQYFIQADGDRNGFSFVAAQTPHTFQIVNQSTTTTSPTTTPSTTRTSTTSSSSESATDISSNSSSSKSKNTGAIVGGVIGAVAVIMIAVVLWRCRSRRKRAKIFNPNIPHPYPVPPSSFRTSTVTTTTSPSNGDSKRAGPQSSDTASSSGPGTLRKAGKSTTSLSTTHPGDPRSQGGRSTVNGSESGNQTEDIELRDRLELMAERVRQLEIEREYWGEQPPDYMSSAGNDEGPSQPIGETAASQPTRTPHSVQKS